MTSKTEDFVRNSMSPANRRHFQPIALRIIAEAGGVVEINRIRQAILARHPGAEWGRRYPLKVLKDCGVIDFDKRTARLVEDLDSA